MHKTYSAMQVVQVVSCCLCLETLTAFFHLRDLTTPEPGAARNVYYMNLLAFGKNFLTVFDKL